MSFASDQERFMLASKQTVGTFNYRQACFYETLVDEEYQEFKTAMAELRSALKYPGIRNLVDLSADVADGLIDVMVTCLGVGHSLGIDMDKAWAEVKKSNLSKICPTTGKVEKNPETGKVMKPAHYSPPNMTKVVKDSWRDAPYKD